jgi:hypothetical protein
LAAQIAAIPPVFPINENTGFVQAFVEAARFLGGQLFVSFTNEIYPRPNDLAPMYFWVWGQLLRFRK